MIRVISRLVFVFISLVVVVGKNSPVHAWDNLGGGDHGGADWTISVNTQVAGVHTNVGTFTINNGVAVTVQPYNGTTYGTFEVQANTITLNGTLDASIKGFRGTTNSTINGEGPGGGASVGTSCPANHGGGGGGHGAVGGRGGNSLGGVGGQNYDSYLSPIQMGSAGGAGNPSGSCVAGGTGGGAIKLTATGTLTVGANITANGQGNLSRSGGGAGGSINLTAGTLAGTASLSANGGSTNELGGGGAGGRISLHYTTANNYSGTTTASGGSSVSGTAGVPGTILVVDDTNNDIVIPVTQYWYATPSAEGVSHTFRDVSLTNNATLYIKSYYTNNNDGVGITFNVRNFTINTGSSVNGNSFGYQGGYGNGTGPSAGQGICGSANIGGAGGGHGGAGGNGAGGQTKLGGSAIGSSNSPVLLGSSGGGAQPDGCAIGGHGGSAIKINSSGTVNLLGTITMNGGNAPSRSGGGAGGSIWIIANTISGSANLSANGGAGAELGGGGGGGRVYLSYRNSLTWNGSATVTGGTSSYNAGGSGSSGSSALPQTPSTLAQYKSDGTTLIDSGSSTNETSVVLKAQMAAGGNYTLRLESEVKPIGVAFENIPTATGSGVSYTGTPVTGSVTVTGLSDVTNYHWQSRVCNSSDCSGWVSYGGSPYDFRVFLNQNPTSPSSLGPSNMTDNSAISDTTPTFTFNLSDPDAGNNVYYQIQIATDANYSAVVVDYTSAADSQGSFSFTVGQLLNNGAYAVGNIGQALENGSYYWRVKTYDSSNAESSFAVASIGAPAFTIDSSAPGTNATNFSFSNATTATWSKLEPRFTWTAGNDAGGNILGYCVAVTESSIGGATPSADPAITGGVLGGIDDGVSETFCPFIATGTSLDLSTVSGLSLTTNKHYYISVKAVDDAGNVFAGSASDYQNVLNFKYDGTLPNNVTSISGAGGTFSNVADMYFSWPTTGNTAASDAESGLLGYQYSINDQSNWTGTVSDTNTGLSIIPATASATLNLDQTRDGSSVIVGSNTIYFRTVDVAGNTSSTSTYRTAAVAYGGQAPTFSGDASLTITPQAATENSFAFEWDAASPSAGRTITSYYYMVNTLPPATLATITDNAATYIATTGLAVSSTELTGVVRGSNTLYIVAVDDLNNYSPSNYLSASFTLNTDNPDSPKNLAVSDASIKSASLWRASLAWAVPDYTGLGSVTYTVQRSLDGETWTTVGTTSGTAFVDTVATSSKYYWRVGTSDSAAASIANPSFSNAVTLTPKGSYTSAADLTSGPSAGSITTKKAKISWTTGRTADSKIAFGTETAKYQTEEPSNSSQVTDHVINLTNLSPGTKYYYVSKWTDEDGNTGTSAEKTFTTQSAPVIKENSESSIGLETAIISFTSINASKVKLYYGKSTDFGGSSTIETASTESSYSMQITGLEDGTKYYYKLNGFDSEGSEYEGEIHAFETLPRPRVSDIKLQQVAGTAETTVLVTWKSNTEISSIVTVYPKNQPDLDRDIVDLVLREGSHSLVVSSLMPSTEYSLVVKGRDKMGNEAMSSSLSFTTATDTRPPVVKNVKIVGSATPISQSGQSTAQLIISWDTDELSTSQIEYGEGSGLNYTHKSQQDNNLTSNHVVVISNLTPSQVYHLRVLSADSAGNQGMSGDVVTIAPKAVKSAVDLVINNLTQIFNIKK